MIVFDSSTLILLAKIDLLQSVLSESKGIIPESVKNEVEHKETMDSMLITRQIEAGSLIVKNNPDKKKISKIRKDFPLGKGEIAAFIIANENNYILGTDDGLAIKVCKIFGIRFIAAIHFLIDSGLGKDIILAKLDMLKYYGRYSAKIIEDAERRIMKG